jgi:hypothetical protein
MTERKRGAGRWIALGTVLGLVAAWGGFALVGAAPSTLTTCTNLKNGKTKLVASTALCKPGKAVGQTWDDHAVASAQLAGAQAQVLALQKQLQQEGALSAAQIAKLEKTIAKLTALSDATQARIDAVCADVVGDPTIQNAISSNPQAEADFSSLCP